MRILLRDSERRPDPPPVVTDDRKAMLTGLLLWLIAAGVVLVAVNPVDPDTGATALRCIGAGVALGVIGLGYTQLMRRLSRPRRR